MSTRRVVCGGQGQYKGGPPVGGREKSQFAEEKSLEAASLTFCSLGDEGKNETRSEQRGRHSKTDLSRPARGVHLGKTGSPLDRSGNLHRNCRPSHIVSNCQVSACANASSSLLL